MIAGARTSFDAVLAQGRRPLGAFVTSSDPSATAVFGRAGYDWVVIDREHGMGGIESLVAHLYAAEASGLTAVVRVLENRPAVIQQTLDAGAHGVIVPKVGSADEARRALAATQYEPGGRGMCPAVPAAGFTGRNWADHRKFWNDNVLLIPLIETRSGVDNIEEILDVEGIDTVFFGHADLSLDLGLDMVEDRATLVAHWERVANAAHARGARAGAALGFGLGDLADFGTLGSDLGSMRAAADDALARFRESEPSLPGKATAHRPG